jgi:hypothetical protein
MEVLIARVPHFSRPLREVGTTDARTAVLEVAVAFAFASVERTLLSVAFDVDLDVDVDTDLAYVSGLVIPTRVGP